MIASFVALVVLPASQIPNVPSPPAPTLAEFLSTLPVELGFLKKLKHYKTAEVHVVREQVGSIRRDRKYYEFEFVTKRFPEKDLKIPQSWARVLKRELTKARGWKLAFPVDKSWDANASRTSLAGVVDFELQFRNRYGICYFYVYDTRKPHDVKDGKVPTTRIRP